MTYNHARYIKQCLQSIESQETDFDFEVVIGDDFSSDDNRKVIENFIASSSNPRAHYRLLDRPENGEYHTVRQECGRLYNFANIVDECNGEFIALVDGDDYWLDNTKLQQQADVLLQNADCNIVFHPVIKVDDDGNSLEITNLNTEVKTEFTDLLMGNYIHTASVMVRTFSTFRFPDWFTTMPMGDWPYMLIHCRTGAIRMLPAEMAAYRIHDGGMWSGERKSAHNRFKLQQDLRAVKTIYVHFRDQMPRKRFLDHHYHIALNTAMSVVPGKLRYRLFLLSTVLKVARPLFFQFLFRTFSTSR